MNDNRNEPEALRNVLQSIKQLQVDLAELHRVLGDRFLLLRDGPEPETGTAAFNTIGKACSGNAAALNTRKPSKNAP